MNTAQRKFNKAIKARRRHERKVRAARLASGLMVIVAAPRGRMVKRRIRPNRGVITSARR